MTARSAASPAPSARNSKVSSSGRSSRTRVDPTSRRDIDHWTNSPQLGSAWSPVASTICPRPVRRRGIRPVRVPCRGEPHSCRLRACPEEAQSTRTAPCAPRPSNRCDGCTHSTASAWPVLLNRRAPRTDRRRKRRSVASLPASTRPTSSTLFPHASAARL